MTHPLAHTIPARLPREIPLTQGKIALVDPEDYERVIAFKWHAARRISTSTERWYAAHSTYTDKKRSAILLHRFLLSLQGKEDVDHRNGDGLDNRRENLRVCTRSQNNANARKHRGSYRYKGVCLDVRDGRWQVEIRVEGQRIYVGRYPDEKDAARAYNDAAVRYFGEFARLNDLEGER